MRIVRFDFLYDACSHERIDEENQADGYVGNEEKRPIPIESERQGDWRPSALTDGISHLLDGENPFTNVKLLRHRWRLSSN